MFQCHYLILVVHDANVCFNIRFNGNEKIIDTIVCFNVCFNGNDKIIYRASASMFVSMVTTR